MSAERQWTPLLGRDVKLRPGTSDRQVWADTFTGLYHLPPDEMPTPGTVLDLGANIGLTAAHYRYLWPQAEIVALELDADCVEVARQNAPSVEVRHCAVSAHGGLGSYNPAGLAEAFAFTPVGKLAGLDLPDGHVCVESVTLEDLIGPEGVDFVKMDIEGEEWALFYTGAKWAPLVRHLVVELHGDGTYASDALVASACGWLTGMGFEARHHPPHPQAVYAWR